MKPVEARFYSVREISIIFGCTTVSVYRWIKNGTLPSTKMGGRRLIPRDAIEVLATGTIPKEAA